MKRLIFDYYRRWWWVFFVVAVFTLRRGWLMAARPGEPFEFSVFMVSLWAGSMLLSFDFARGLMRAMGMVPLTAQQIGRSWWFAAVGIPAAALTALLLAGASVQVMLNPGSEFPALAVLLASLFAFVWLGTSFVAICAKSFNMTQSAFGFFGTGFLSLLSMLVFFGSMAKGMNASHDPVKTGLLLSLGGFLTLASWVIAGNLILGRPAVPQIMSKGARVPRLTPLEIKLPPPEATTSTGLTMTRGQGGLAYLLRATFVKAYLVSLSLLAIMGLAAAIFGPKSTLSSVLDTTTVLGGLFSTWIIFLTTILPMLHQLRFLRSMPVPAVKLAATLLAMPLLPLMAVTATMAIFIGATVGVDTAWTVVKFHLVNWVQVPLFVCVLFWRGFSKIALLVCLSVAVAFQLGWMTGGATLGNEPARLASLFGLVAASLVLGWLVLSRMLRSSSRTFRPPLPQNNPYNVFGGGVYR